MNEENKEVKEIIDSVTKAKSYLIAYNSQYVLESEKDLLFESCFSELERIRLMAQNIESQ